MEEIIEKLARTLEEIEGYHGVVKDLSTHGYVAQLHRQAREYITELRKMVAESRPEIKSGYYDIPVTQLKTGDIFCPPSGNPPGIITQIYRDPLTASNDYPMVTFKYEGDLCGKRICDIRQDQIVRVYRGNLEDANNAWTAKHGTEEA